MQMKQLGLITMLIGCTPTSPATIDGGGTAFGQKVVVDGPMIMPIELLEDSRCPANAQCAWPGQVRIKAKWMRDGGEKMIELTSGQPLPLADGALTLTEVRPIRMTTEKIAREDYRFEFSFAGGL
jgi:hypothetical protein